MSFARAAAFAAIVSLLSVVSATAKPIATTAETNLRKGPGTDTDVLTLLPKGTTVDVGKCANDWCEASFEGKDGYVFSRNIGAGPRPAPRRPPPVVGEVIDEGPVYGRPVYGPPPVYYRPYPYGYYRPWGFGWGWGYRYW